MSNLTPRQIAIYSSLTIALELVALLAIVFLVPNIPTIASIIIIPGILFITAGIIFNFFIVRFIYDRIKIIHKNIHPLMTNKEDNIVKYHNNIIEEVENEVMEWADEKQREIEALRETEIYRKEFMGNATHELKTPIFNIQGYLHTLIDSGLQDEKVNIEFLHKCAKNLERLNNIVEDLDTIYLLESNNLVLDQIDFDIVMLALEVIESLEMQADANDITLRLKNTSLKPIQVTADRERIRQVLNNLIINSIKYGSETEGVTEIGFYDTDDQILVEIVDNGPGIEKEHLPRLFERFYRVDKSRSRAKGGTGLGLSIVNHILDAHSQTLNVRSSPGMGSTFGFTLSKP